MPRDIFRPFALSLVAFAAVLAGPTKNSEPPQDASFIPVSLSSWIPWVMESLGDSACPGDDDDSRLCVAVSRLEVRADKAGASFVLSGRRYSRGEVTLPGDSTAWPIEVQDGASRIPVIGDPSSNPIVERPAGPFRITGRLKWRKRPSSLTIPDDIAVKSLLVDGRVAAWDPDGNRMWLEDRTDDEAPDEDEAANESDTVESLQIRVFRLLADGSPMRLTTTLQLVVGGKERRLKLDSVLPVNSRPLSMTTPLAGRLDAKGGMELTIRPGTWEVEVESALKGTPTVLAPSNAPYPWPTKEVWSFREASAFRAISLEGAPSVDPTQAGLDPSKRDLPTWSLDRAHPLQLKVTRQGSLDPDSLKIAMSRTIWIDRDGRGATVSEGLSVQTVHPMRLSVFAPIEAGRILVNGSARLITSSGRGELGVNLPFGQREVEVLGRVSDGNWRDLPIASTGIRPEQANVSVVAPPGWWILHLSGPSGSEATSTWLSRWGLAECLWALVLVAMFHYALGWIGGGLALAMCLAGAHDRLSLEPWFALGLVLSARKAVSMHLPRFEPRLGAAAPALFVVLAWCCWSSLGYSADQWTRIVHPSARLPENASSLGGILRGNFALAKQAEAPMADTTAVVVPAMQPTSYAEGTTEMRTVARAPSSPSGVMSNSVMDRLYTVSDGLMGEDVDPNQSASIDAILAEGKKYDRGFSKIGGRALGGEEQNVSRSIPKPTIATPESTRDPFLEGSIQTGPGVPRIAGEVARLECPRWPGLDAHVGIFTASIGWVRLIRLLGIGLCWWLAWLAFRAIDRTKPVRPREGSNASVVPIGLGLLVLLLPGRSGAQDTYPTEALLGELKSKLVRPPACGTNCADISLVRVEVRGNEVRSVVTVSALAKTSIWLPRGDWELSDIRCDDCTIGAQGKDPWVIVDKGVHTVTMSAKVVEGDLVVSFPVRPRLLETHAPGWTRQDEGRTSVHLTKNGQRGAAIETRESVDEPDGPRKNPGAMPFVSVEREFEFLREWTVTTRLSRASQFEGAIAISYPLVAGETSLDGQASDSGKAHWVLPSGTNSVVYRTRLRRADTLVLAATDGPWSETWRVRTLDRLRIVANGAAPTGRGDLVWNPFPGERVTLVPKAHPAAKGAIATIQKATLSWTDDPQSSKGTLEVTTETSQATDLKFQLPEGARLGTTISNGHMIYPTHLPDGRWNVPLPAYSSDLRIDWVAESNRSFFRRTPRVALSAVGVNFRTVLQPASDRFAIASGGDGLGTRMVWWAFLPFFVGAAFAFSRWTHGAIGFGPALLVALPFTTIQGAFGKAGLLTIVLLFFLLRWRSRQDPSSWSRQRFFLVQLEIVAVAVLALWSFVSLLSTPLNGAPDFWRTDSSGAWTWTLPGGDGTLPAAWIFELPVWTWRLAMAIWSLYVLRSAIPWIRKGWSEFGRGGYLPTADAEVQEVPVPAPSKTPEPSTGDSGDSSD